MKQSTKKIDDFRGFLRGIGHYKPHQVKPNGAFYMAHIKPHLKHDQYNLRVEPVNESSKELKLFLEPNKKGDDAIIIGTIKLTQEFAPEIEDMVHFHNNMKTAIFECYKALNEQKK